MEGQMTKLESIALIGYGEVGQILAADLHTAGIRRIAAWDTSFADSRSAPARALAVRHVQAEQSAMAASAGAQLVISAVTAAQTVAAAQAFTTLQGAWFLDLNSVSPQTKQAAAAHIEKCGGKYVEGAVMAPISPKRSGTAILLGGPHAGAFASVAHSIGFTGAQFFSAEVGQASAAKMCRSVIVKGLEALLGECMLAAHSYGVTQSVVESLRDLFPRNDWRAMARYMIGRSLVHGARRAEEMREVARTLDAVGVEPRMSLACSQWQDWAPRHKALADRQSLEELLEAMLGADGARGRR
jgi:3-hydroxyisobutyrate dehydrogenase-like beta-hydroxyacid dehydrogenase